MEHSQTHPYHTPLISLASSYKVDILILPFEVRSVWTLLEKVTKLSTSEAKQLCFIPLLLEGSS
jgi:hypothetical protein